MAAFRRTLVLTGGSLLAVAALAWPADWAVWKLHHSPMDTVEVSRFVVASLKGNKEEYYPDGDAQVPCSQSALPQGGANPCYWVQRHKVVFDR